MIWGDKIVETVKWKTCHQLPMDGEVVLCVDILGNMAICVYDAYLKEFHLSFSGACHAAADAYGEAVFYALKNVLKKLKKEDFINDLFENLEEEVAESFSEVYFDEVEYWMPKPPIPLSIAFLGDYQADEICFMTNNILDNLEPIIKASIHHYVKQNTSIENNDDTSQLPTS